MEKGFCQVYLVFAWCNAVSICVDARVSCFVVCAGSKLTISFCYFDIKGKREITYFSLFLLGELDIVEDAVHVAEERIDV